MSQAVAKIVAFGAIAFFVIGAFISGLILLSEITEALWVLLVAVFPLFILSEYGFMSRAGVRPKTRTLAAAGWCALWAGLLAGAVAEVELVAWAELVVKVVNAGIVLLSLAFQVALATFIVVEIGRRTYRLFKGR